MTDSFEIAGQKADTKARQKGLKHPDRKHDVLVKLLSEDISLERAWSALNLLQGRASASTVEALMYGLREGVKSLATHPDRQRRLSQLSRKQLLEVCDRLQKFRPEIAQPWTRDEVKKLVAIWRKIHG